MPLENPEISTILSSAPETLARRTPPIILIPDYYGEVYTLGFLPLDPQDSFLKKLDHAAREKKLESHNLSAGELLRIGLETPKDVYDHNGLWFLESFDDLERYVEELRFGRKIAAKPLFEHDEQSTFHIRSEEWRRAVRGRAHGGTLWEGGIIVDSPKGMSVLSYSNPWDDTHIPWYDRLTEPEIFVGREKELEVFSQFLTGKSVLQNDLERGFNASQTELWWDGTAKANKIVRGRYEEVRQRIGQPYSDRLLALLKRRVPSRRLYEMIQNATRISGYEVTASSTDFPGSIETHLSIDESNWVGPPNKRSGVVPQIESYEYKEQHEPPEETMWKEGSGSLYNDDDKEKNGSFGVYIVFEEEHDLSAKGRLDRVPLITQIQIARRVKLNETSSRRYSYWLNNPEFGDGVLKSDRYPSKKQFNPWIKTIGGRYGKRLTNR